MACKPVISKVALTEQVSALLQERILDGVYRPAERLNIDALSREFEVSSSPIREALTRLVAMGLVTSTSFAGFSVTAVPPRNWFEQLRDFRILTESWAARQLARCRDPATIARMTASLDAMEPGPVGSEARGYMVFNRADEAFHEALLDACGNEIIAQSVRHLTPHLHHARLFADVPQDIAPVIGEHRAILTAISEGDEAGAAAALEAHLVASWNRYNKWQSKDLKSIDIR